MKEPIKTTSTEIVQYWQAHQTRHTIKVEWEDAEKYCWRCACKRKLQRCHIIPAALGGEDTPSNFVLLCELCHGEGPNVNDPDVMWDWIAAYEAPLYDAFWYIRGLKEYKFIYKKPLEQDICDILAQVNLPPLSTEQLRPYVFSAMDQASVHFGQGLPNAATIAGAYRMVLKSIARDYGIQLPLTRNSGDETMTSDVCT